MKELGSGTTYNTHNTTSLIRTVKYVQDILQTEEAFTVKEYTHTHIHAVYMDTIRAVHYNLNVPYLRPQYVSFTLFRG